MRFSLFHCLRRERRGRAGRENLLDIFDQHVVLDVDGVAGLLETERRRAQRVRNYFDGKDAVLDRENGKADSVDGDRALLDQVARLRGRNLEGEEFGVALGLDRHDPADTVDVARDQMAAEQLAQREASLQIDAAAGLQIAKRGASQGLGRDVHRKAAGAFGNHGQARAVDGDRIADIDFGHGQRGMDGNHRALTGRLEAFDSAEVFDDTGEHHLLPRSAGAAGNTPEKSYLFDR